ncbi:TrbI/VirB10 family protein [Novosphingobium sp. P6W]|uniref:TrbI/VirB10 family protein n=1 Tax=Novosphingobium sp. P6W TaxID=1609758 RepID=UPI0005C2A6F9|nr:TrbI/VirB10 family protein [Novosphingobium sp. P6W]AXB75865.1 conjugal transfer protein TrbI [Novosphingobium sp. P6W]KIS32933.1 conjugal transfer protein TrbI [Novosphingobium sp. P6W]
MTDPVTAAVPPKVDPETLQLRARPPRAIRFRRGVIIGAAALGSVSLVGIAWMALKPQVFRQVAQDTELSQPLAKPASDTLAGLPSSYGDVPKLGPALPGDLGRPILSAQRNRAEGETAPGRTDDNAEARRQQRLAEAKAARESGLLAQIASSQSPSKAGSSNASMTQGELQAGKDAGAPESKPTHKEQFINGRSDAATANSHGVIAPISPNTLLAGSVISASLITGLNSDLPGVVIAQVTQNAYDTVSGRILLVPQGARLIGKYDSVVAYGQRRALVIWQRLILPNGGSVQLDYMPATDPSGFAGVADKVDFHTWTLLKGVAIATMLGVGTELTIDGESDLVEAIRESAQTNTARAGDQITQRNLDIPPTITVRPGAPVRLLVTRDVVLAPWQ